LSERDRKSNALSPGDGYAAKAAALSGIRHNAMQQIADELAVELNAKIQAMPKDSYEDKKAITRFVNAELRRFGMAIRCPKTGEPSTMQATPTANRVDFGRFTIRHRNADGKVVCGADTPTLPTLELIEARPRREGWVEWHKKVSQPTSDERLR
jgi:hypothetical protein